ncbi:N-acetyltransferase [Streptomyces tsukubensis]|uniref:N-acetyltransferase n=1 Tax=Streptomyces tsukubensis TaxID=83656 RepID=A0A1V4AH96_9ACTN|nr:N-acetyltransferase [Streptomyces tsukubensis]OON83055.1 N-acetyltransferase [Streptomyces tsukubensis]QFR91915.1 N-acetyltransferase [Streptomyces tsukubensis]
MPNTDAILITTLAERSELITRVYEISEIWPAFMRHDPVAVALLDLVPEDFPRYCVVATDGERVVARGLCVPFDAEAEGREELPDQGWDRVLAWASHDRRLGRPGTTASALEITVDAEYLGQGLSYRMLGAMRDAVGRQGFGTLLAPVRPTAKHRHPYVPMTEYIGRLRADGLPVDPWLRVHVKSGGRIERVAPASMTIGGSLAQWRRWTGLPFDRDGEVVVDGALVPVECGTGHDYAVYVEPNVWVRHRTRTGDSDIR